MFYPITLEAMLTARTMHDPEPITAEEEKVFGLLTEILNIAYKAGKDGRPKPPKMEAEEASPEQAKACQAFNNFVLEAYEEGAAQS